MTKILVTYATFTGSTKDIAEEIGKTLRKDGSEVDILPMAQVKDLSPYSAVVAGSAIHAKLWLPEAMDFLKKFQAELQQKPFAAFLVCITLAMQNQKMVENANVAGWLAPVRTLVKPVHEGYFAGTLDLSKIPNFWSRLGFRISVLTGVWVEGDHRDWEAIRAWANELGQRLGESV